MSDAINILTSLVLFLAFTGVLTYVIVGVFRFLVNRYLWNKKSSTDNATIK